MPEYTPEQMAYLQAMAQAQQQQQAGGGQGEAPDGKKKKKSLTDIVKGSADTVMRAPEHKERFLSNLDGVVGSFLRSTATTYAVIASAAPIALTNPVSAGLVGVFAGFYAFCATNTMYKMLRDTMYISTAPILKPKKTLEVLIGVLNPLTLIQRVLATPFKLMYTIAKYPIAVSRKKKIGNKEIIVGSNKKAAYLGSFAGGLGGLDLLFPNFIYGLKGQTYKAIEYGKNLLGASSKYLSSAGAKGLSNAPQYAYSLAK